MAEIYIIMGQSGWPEEQRTWFVGWWADRAATERHLDELDRINNELEQGRRAALLALPAVPWSETSHATDPDHYPLTKAGRRMVLRGVNELRPGQPIPSRGKRDDLVLEADWEAAVEPFRCHPLDPMWDGDRVRYQLMAVMPGPTQIGDVVLASMKRR